MRVSKDALFDRQWLRTVGHASYAGAEIGECLAVARRIDRADADPWFDAWSAMAERLFAAAEQSRHAGHFVSARGAYLRASNYWRAAWTFDFDAPLPDRLCDAYRRHRRAFEHVAALMQPAGQPIRIDYEDGHKLHGWFFAAAGDPRPRPTLVICGGYDSTAEECFLFSGAAAIERGYNCLVFDGPGQGASLIEDGLPMRPDWERVVGPVIDDALARPGVDANRVALMGISFGGYLASRAASCDNRIAALIVDPGQLSLLDEIASRIPGFVARRLNGDDGAVLRMVDWMMRRRLGHVSQGWALRRGLLVHGVATPLAYLRDAAAYRVEAPERIACPTLVCAADEDAIGASARALHDALTCPKTFLSFTAAEGAGDHCEAGARAWFNHRAFDWLDNALACAKPGKVDASSSDRGNRTAPLGSGSTTSEAAERATPA